MIITMIITMITMIITMDPAAIMDVMSTMVTGKSGTTITQVTDLATPMAIREWAMVIQQLATAIQVIAMDIRHTGTDFMEIVGMDNIQRIFMD